MSEEILRGKARQHARESLRRLVLQTGGDRCLSCGACVVGCPVSDWSEERLDPRRLVRLIQNGLGDLAVEMDWIWQCTECGRCNYTCPVGVDLASLIVRARGLVPRDRSPGQIQKTADLHRTASNNMGLEVSDWLETGAYEEIMSGEYQRRSDEDTRTYREDLAEAAKGYTDTVQEIVDEVDAAVDRIKSRFTDAWKKGRGQ